jgi:hypothetical protein
VQQQYQNYSSFNLKSGFRFKSSNNNKNRSKNYKPFYYLCSSGGVLCWKSDLITDEELKNEIDDILSTFKVSRDDKNKNRLCIDYEGSREINTDSEWTKIYDKQDLMIWRRPIIIESDEEICEIFEYKVLGRNEDLTPMEYFFTQLDLEFRKKWDYFAVQLNVVDKDKTTNTELIQWVMKFPYPLHPRQYIYARRFCADTDNKILILMSRSLSSKELIKNIVNADDRFSKTYVNVEKYKSHIILIPRNEFNEKGFEYIIQYYDHPKARIPKIA